MYICDIKHINTYNISYSIAYMNINIIYKHIKLTSIKEESESYSSWKILTE